MTPFSYSRAPDAAAAIRLSAMTEGASYLGGGTNLVDLMRVGIAQPAAVIDVTALNAEIAERDSGGFLIGAATSNTAVASHPAIRRHFPMLARAILSGASPQIRNMATVGGNIMQRTRCAYFYDAAARCNKRAPGSGCDAISGFNRMHAVLGGSPHCIASHPSDMCVALVALDASLHIEGPGGERTVPLATFHRLPGEEPEIETGIEPDELIVAVEIPPLPFARFSDYRKVRDRASYAFALVSVAAALDLDADGAIRDVRIALGGVAPRPWRAERAEAALRGGPATVEAFRNAAEAELAPAAPQSGNTFKIELAKRTLAGTLEQLTGSAG